MKTFFCCVILFFAVLAHSAELAIELKMDGKPAASIRLKIEGDIAIATVAGEEESEKFNLKEMSWLDLKNERWTTLEQCKQWAAQSKAQSAASAESAPAKLRPFLRWALEPTFRITKSNGTLRLISGQVDYVVEGEASRQNAGLYFRYATLNAYKKAMTEKKLPPYSELKAISEMEKLGHVPRQISVTMPGIPGAPGVQMEISEIKP